MQDTLPALGYKTYFIRTVSSTKSAKVASLPERKKFPREVHDDIYLENDVRYCNKLCYSDHSMGMVSW